MTGPQLPGIFTSIPHAKILVYFAVHLLFLSNGYTLACYGILDLFEGSFLYEIQNIWHFRAYRDSFSSDINFHPTLT